MADDPLMTPGEVAAAARVQTKTVARWAKAGHLAAIVTPGGHRRYRRSEVVALLGCDSRAQPELCCALGEPAGHDGPCTSVCGHCRGSGACPACGGSSDDGSGLELTCKECGDGTCPNCEEGEIVDAP